jgi:hypothetical protein
VRKESRSGQEFRISRRQQTISVVLFTAFRCGVL